MLCWRSTRVAVKVRGANWPGAVVITDGTFTPEAKELKRIHGIELVDGKLLRIRLQQAVRGEMEVTRRAGKSIGPDTFEMNIDFFSCAMQGQRKLLTV